MIHPGERPAELIDLQGAWRRGGRTFSDDPLNEVTDVLWLQVGSYFCDLRTPYPGTDSRNILDQPQAFSGTVRVGQGAISFHHDLDSLPRDPAHPDEGTVHRKGDTVLERGAGFEERWVLGSEPGDEVGLAELRVPQVGGTAPMARLIRVGSVALGVWGGATPGGAQFSRSTDWSRERSLHDCDEAGGIDATAQKMGRGEPLPDGWFTIDPREA